MVWKARGTSLCSSIKSVSRQFRIDADPFDNYNFMEQINLLNDKIGLAIGSDIDCIFEVYEKKSQHCINLEDHDLLMTMKTRELERINNIQSRLWAQNCLKR